MCFLEEELDSCFFHPKGGKRESPFVRQLATVVKIHMSLGIQNRGFYGHFTRPFGLRFPACPAPMVMVDVDLSCAQPPEFIFLIWPNNFIPVAICLNKEPGEGSRAWGYSMKISGCSGEQLRSGTALGSQAFRAGWKPPSMQFPM